MNNLKKNFRRLDISEKVILIGAAIGALSVFLTWYKDLDKFNTGDSYIGITGPLYLAGLVFMVASISSFGLVMMSLLEKRKPQLPMKESFFHSMLAGVSLFMLVLSLSVFFHSKFGINITEKQMGIGMIMAFVGSGGVLIGSILNRRERQIHLTEDGHIEDRVKSGIGAREVRESMMDSLEEFTRSNEETTNEIDINGR
ncbi:hypothetical protein COU74_05035 [Candidatus Peregrinibacteria bacterium CG10_big_fil_rev_8_21_14_0_10_36_19]|nr:MAG: hypothetical protein COU74_05035 [Candidatus Peregrinibacteria bacterium CG10_big_fil_rev_8_21_14_0_10_36_19]